MSAIRRIFPVLATLLLALSSQGLMAQQALNTQPIADSGAEGALGIAPGGDPIFKVYGLNSLGCASTATTLDVKIINTASNAYVQTIVEAGGSTYMNQSFFVGEIVAIEGIWTLFNDSTGGAVDGVWPIPDDTEINVTINITDGDGGAVLYTRELVISKCNGGALTSNQVVGEVSQPTRATFIVLKIFEDGNPAEVDVAIDCNTGLILDQDKTVKPGVPIEFVVTSFTNETLNCTITETSTDGYSAVYQTSEFGFSDEACEFQVVEDGEQGVCVIINTPDPVDIKVTKNWVIEGENNDVSLFYRLDLSCNGGEIVGSDYDLGEGPGSEVHTFTVIPDYPSTSCVVFEDFYDDAIESDNGCGRGQVIISAGNGASCTITNTVFFEGIPTLSQYGMAIMALLMLGMGFVGFRRFA